MAYTKTAWVDNQEPAVNAANLNNIENGVSDHETRISAIEGHTHSWNDLTDKPTIPDVSGFATKTDVNKKADKTAIPDVSGLAKQADLDAALDRLTAVEAQLTAPGE